ncbi:hypothetical protein SDC9_141319 [bioreactor metagenome]|uniref:Uncharacterized protein n=1 Tax=bioreactor metagenome TaxID=1076179 RepID=A0A645DXB5_9ZZZZ
MFGFFKLKVSADYSQFSLINLSIGPAAVVNLPVHPQAIAILASILEIIVAAQRYRRHSTGLSLADTPLRLFSIFACYLDCRIVF